MYNPELLGHSLGCLADNLKVPDDCILHHSIAQKSFSVLTKVPFNAVGALQNMGQVDARVFRQGYAPSGIRICSFSPNRTNSKFQLGFV